MKKNICIVTGTRAEYGLFLPLIKKIQIDADFNLRLVVTGAHLSPEFGLTYKQIEEDGFHIHRKIHMLLSSDSSSAINKSMGLALISFGDYFEESKPDMLVVLGDRYEIFAASTAAAIARIPIAHIHGGETTEGAMDEFLRHSITKMSYLHFTSTEEHRKRVIQLGESPERVFDVGALGVENIKTIDLLSRGELEDSINFKLDKSFGLVTFHPVTLEENTASNQFKELLDAILSFDNMKFIITKSNADSEGRIINEMIDEFVKCNPEKVVAFTSLGQKRYLSAMKHCDFVLGNSSSGIIEAPSFNIPTINVGDRQKGRMQANSIINCEPICTEIKEAIKLAMDIKFREIIENTKNPYGNGDTSNKITSTIKNIFNEDNIHLKKNFYNII